MAIQTARQFKVYEQARDDSGCGAILASYSEGDVQAAQSAAQLEADRLARANPSTRYYVLVTASAVYCNRDGDLVRREY